MDTKHLEQIGETFIVSSLLDAEILVAKPFFDRLGTDLVGFSSAWRGTWVALSIHPRRSNWFKRQEKR